jgi:hypothetical protein
MHFDMSAPVIRSRKLFVTASYGTAIGCDIVVKAAPSMAFEVFLRPLFITAYPLLRVISWSSWRS